METPKGMFCECGLCKNWLMNKTARCTCHYTDDRVEDPKCPRHKPSQPEKCGIQGDCPDVLVGDSEKWGPWPCKTNPVAMCRHEQCRPSDSETAVEAKIEEIKNKIKSWADSYLAEHLRELVKLAQSDIQWKHDAWMREALQRRNEAKR